jgi:hypothetical protein
MKPDYERPHLNFLGECSAKHQSLPLTGGRHIVLLDNATDLRLKAHVEHAVSLIQNEESTRDFINLD